MATPRTLKEYQEARRAARAAEQTAPLPGSAVARIQREAALDQAETRQDQMTDIMENTQYDAQKGQASPAVLRHNREAMVQAPAPDETTVPTMTWAEMSKRARELGVKPQSLGWAGLKGVGLVAGENKLHGTLKEMEEFAPGDVEGSTWAAQAFGAADKLQRGLTRGAQALYDPLDDERSRLLEGQKKRREAVAKTGAMIPPALLQRDIEELADLERRVTGVQSYTREVDKDAGKAMPLQAVMDSNLTSKALSVPVRAQAMFNSAQADVADMLPHGKPMLPPGTTALPRNEAERVAREIAKARAPQNPGEAAAGEDGGVLSTWANEDRKRAQELNQAADTLQEGLPLSWFKNLPPEEQVRIGGMAGEVEGEVKGNMLQTGLPTALTGGLYVAAKAAPMLMKHAVSPALRHVAKNNLDNPTVKKLVGKFVQNPAALTLGPAGADAALLAENTARTAPDLMQRQLVEDMVTSYPPFGSLTQADKQAILSFQRPKSMAGGAVFDVLQEAQRVRHDPALQAKASPAVQDLLEKWTPREVQLAKDVGIPKPGPFHPEYGQDITQSGGVLQTRAAVDRAEQAAVLNAEYRKKEGLPKVIDDLQARVRDVSPEEFAASPSGVGLMKSGLATYRQVREPAVEAALKELTAAERSLVDTLPEAAIPGILSRRDMLRRVSQGQGTDADLAELVVAKTGTTQRVGDRMARGVEAEGGRARRAVDDVVNKMDRGLDQQGELAARSIKEATLAERQTLERLDDLAQRGSGIASKAAERQANQLRADIFQRMQAQHGDAYRADAALRDAGEASMDQARSRQWKFMENQPVPDTGRATAGPHLAEEFPRAMNPAVRQMGTKARSAMEDVVGTAQRGLATQRDLAGEGLANMAGAERQAMVKMGDRAVETADKAAARVADVSEKARAEIYKRMSEQRPAAYVADARQVDAAEGAMEGARGRQWQFMEGQKTAGEALDDFSPAQKAAEDKVMDALGISRAKSFKTSDGLSASRHDRVRRLARQMMAAPRESAFTQDMGNELRQWAGLPPKEFTAAELREAEKYATTVATRRTGGAVKALEEAGNLPLSEVTGVRLKTGIPASESLDLLQRQISSGRAPNKAVLEELKQVTDGSNVFAGANATAKRSGRGLVAEQFAETFTQDMGAMRGDKPTSFGWFHEHLAGLRRRHPEVDLSDVTPSVLARDFEGAVREGRPPQLPEKLRALLAKEEDVFVIATPRGNGPGAMLADSEMLRAVDALSGPKSPAVIRYQAPTAEIAAKLNGRVVDRWYAKALIEGQSAAVAAQSHGELAKALNKWLGAARMNYAFTVGRPGFQAKNMFNNTSRALADEPKAQQSVPLLMRIMKAPLRDATPVPELGMTAGQAHKMLLETSGAGHGWLDEATKSFQEMPRSAFHDAVAARSPRAAKAMDALPDAVMGAGALENKATDLAFQVALFGERLPPGYTAEDGLKMLLAVHKMKRGVVPAEVARQVQRALINFGAQNAFQQEWKFFIPFMKYYTGAMEGAAYLTAKNPEQLRWLNRYVEANQAYDRGTHDQRALSPRLRTDGEAAGFQPMVRDESGALRTYMADTVVNEGGQLLDTARAGLAPEPGERGIMGLAGPWIGDSVAQVTGKQPGTDRWVVPFSDENQARAAQLNALERWGPLARANMPLAMALELIEHPEQYRTDPLSDSGKAAVAYYALRYTPLVSQFGSQPIVAALSKWALGVRGNNPASATEEARGEEIARTLTRWFTGAGITPVDPVKRQAAQSNKARKQMIETPVGIEDRLRDSGRASE